MIGADCPNIHTVLPGLLSCGYISYGYLGPYLERKLRLDIGRCGNVTLFLIGTILGPFVFVPAGLIALVRAAIDPDSYDRNNVWISSINREFEAKK